MNGKQCRAVIAVKSKRENERSLFFVDAKVKIRFYAPQWEFISVFWVKKASKNAVLRVAAGVWLALSGR